MIVMNFEDGLELLREHDIRVVAASIVDSAEGAVAFSARRPIDLCLLVSVAATNPTEIEGELRATDSIRHAYRRLEARALTLPTGRILARRYAEAGTNVVVEARDDAALGRIVEIRGGAHVVHRLLPLGENQAEAMLEEFHSKHGIASSGARTRMLAHLLLRVSEIFDNDAIVLMRLDPVRVHDNSYDVLAVHISSTHPIELKRRLAHHAHDRKGHYTPSGQQ